MSKYDPTDPAGDPFGPPAIPTLVGCLHCRQEYDSYRIEWRIEQSADGKPHGFWCCPTPGCGGIGFGCDIFPVDPDYRDERGGWFTDDGEPTTLEELERLDRESPPDGTGKGESDDDPIPF